MKAKLQQTVNEWWRTYGDPMFKPDWNKIKLSAANTYEHNLRVCEVCCVLIKHGIPFVTEARLHCGARPDIIAPTHVQPIIEVLWSETKDDFMNNKAHKYPVELKGKWILHNAEVNFTPEVIF